MKLHLIGGFLGSGKTTAIIHAAKHLMDQGQRVGVITNDQGKYLVDTAFFRLADIPAVEVTGGCFCCNYNDLDQQLAQLIEESQPEVIFAESVGSCADIVATVVKPLLQLGQNGVKPSSFSVFADARLLRRRLRYEEMPFSDDVVYIFDKQIEEAGLLVVNKIDLLSDLALDQLKKMLEERFPDKPYLLQTSLTEEGVAPWLAHINDVPMALADAALEIDYDRYGAGEAQLAWLDEQVKLNVPVGQGRVLLREIMGQFIKHLAQRGAGIGHLKFIIESDASDRGPGANAKISFTTIEEPGWEERIPVIHSNAVRLLVNARVEMEAEALKALFREILDDSGLAYVTMNAAAFHPGMPNPTHRME